MTASRGGGELRARSERRVEVVELDREVKHVVWVGRDLERELYCKRVRLSLMLSRRFAMSHS